MSYIPITWQHDSQTYDGTDRQGRWSKVHLAEHDDVGAYCACGVLVGGSVVMEPITIVTDEEAYQRNDPCRRCHAIVPEDM